VGSQRVTGGCELLTRTHRGILESEHFSRMPISCGLVVACPASPAGATLDAGHRRQQRQDAFHSSLDRAFGRPCEDKVENAGETSGRGHYVFIFLAMDHAHDVSTAPFTPEQAICQIWELPKTPQTIFCQEAAPFQPPQTPEYFVSGRTRPDRVGSKLLPSLKTIDVDPPCKGVSTKAKSPPDRDGDGI
jgi:hypothetical protein